MKDRGERAVARHPENFYQIDSIASDLNDPTYNPESPINLDRLDWRYKPSHLTSSEILDRIYENMYEPAPYWIPYSDVTDYSPEQMELDNALSVILSGELLTEKDEKLKQQKILKTHFKGKLSHL